MTPGARIAAAIEILDHVEGGMAAEQALTRWARASRFAGSKDRAAVRDHVFAVLRRFRSTAHAGGGMSGRARMIGLLRLQGTEPGVLFTGQGHSPQILTQAEAAYTPMLVPKAVAMDIPDWLLPDFESSLGGQAAEIASLLHGRAPVTLRVNAALSNPQTVTDRLGNDGILARSNPLSKNALSVIEGARKLRTHPLYLAGEFEFQDASSQAVVDALPPFHRVLDYCAGGGGKALALAARQEGTVFAHDADSGRMKDIPGRAARAQARVKLLSTPEIDVHAPFDLVLCDVPCSGSGAWRRTPMGKWSLTPEQLAQINQTQQEILDKASRLVARDGTLAYVTCSVLDAENKFQIKAFLQQNTQWKLKSQKQLIPSKHGDGFFVAQLTRD